MADENTFVPDFTQSDASGAPAASSTETPRAVNWQGSYNGMKGHAITLQKALNAANSRISELSQEVEGTKLTLTSEVQTLTSERTTLAEQARIAKEERDTAARERDQLKAQREVGADIRTKFPQVSHLYDKGLMPGVEAMSPEARTEYLTNLATEFGQVQAANGAQQVANVQTAVAGSTPAPVKQGRSETIVTLDDAAREVENAYRQHGPRSTQYQQAYANYEGVLRTPAK